MVEDQNALKNFLETKDKYSLASSIIISLESYIIRYMKTSGIIFIMPMKIWEFFSELLVFLLLCWDTLSFECV